jgi:small ligand-binding sensory domain FIST
MKWASAICGPDGLGRSREELKRAIEECAKQLKKDVKNPDLVVGFIAPQFRDFFDSVPELVQSAIGSGVFLGCSAGGSIGGGKEVEQKPCVAFTAAELEDVVVKPFHFTKEMMPDPDAPTESWEKLVGVKPDENPDFIIIPDPFTLHSDDVIRGFDYAFPRSVKIGGLASGTNEPGGNALFLNDKTYRAGLVGIALTGNIVVDTVVAQGCKPIGKPLRVTKSKKHILFELDGEPAVMVLKKVMDGLSGFERDLARDAMFLGVVMKETGDQHKAGDFLIRNILGIEQNSGALVVGEILHDARTVQFHVRDAATSADDLRFLLKKYRDEKLSGDASGVKGALLFSCLGRGNYLYGRPNHDSDCFRDYLGEVPLGGFFCNGEIGPVGSSTYLHGYTSSFGIFRQK